VLMYEHVPRVKCLARGRFGVAVAGGRVRGEGKASTSPNWTLYGDHVRHVSLSTVEGRRQLH